MFSGPWRQALFDSVQLSKPCGALSAAGDGASQAACLPAAPGARTRRRSPSTCRAQETQERVRNFPKVTEPRSRVKDMGVDEIFTLSSCGYTTVDKTHTAPACVKFTGWCEG